MDGISDSNTAAMVQRHPAGTAGGVEHGVEQWPVGDGVRSVEHGLGLAVGRCHRSGVEVVASDHDGCLDLAGAHQVVEAVAGFGALAVLEPANAGGKSLEMDLFTG